MSAPEWLGVGITLGAAFFLVMDCIRHRRRN
jgi:hypothetical protein